MAEGATEEAPKELVPHRSIIGRLRNTLIIKRSSSGDQASGQQASGEKEGGNLDKKESMGPAMMRRVRSLQRMVRKPSKEITVTEEQVNRMKETLPPPAPESLDGTGKRDVSLYTTTWNMAFCESPTESTVQYWLPQGYDIYVISLQNCTAFLDLSKTCVNYLKDGEDTYEEFMDFLHVQTDSITQQSNLILLFLVHSSLLAEDVFQRSNLKRQKPSMALTSTYSTSASSLVKGRKREPERRSGGVLIMQFEVFDTVVLVINAQLTKGVGRTRERLSDIRSIVNYVNSIEADHVILMGDMGTEGIDEFDDDDVIKHLKEGNKNGKGWGDDRFTKIVETDEITCVLHQQVTSFHEFEELPINFPPTSVRRVTKDKITQRYLAERFHENYDITALYQKNGRVPAYNERIFFKSISAQHKPGFKAFDTGSCEGVNVSSNVPVFTTFRVGSKEFSIPEEEFIKTIVDDDDLEVITNELQKYAPEDVRQKVEKTRVEKMKSATKLYIEETDEGKGGSATQLIEHEDEDEEEEAELESESPLGEFRPNRLFRPNAGLRRESYVTVFDLLSLPPPPLSQLNAARRQSVQSSISMGPPPPPPVGKEFTPYDSEKEDSLFSDSDEEEDNTKF